MSQLVIPKSGFRKHFSKIVNEAIAGKQKFRVESDDLYELAPHLVQEYGWVEKRGSTPTHPNLYNDRITVTLLDGTEFLLYVKNFMDWDWGVEVIQITSFKLLKRGN